MNWFKFLIIFLLLLLGLYGVSMFFVKESKDATFENEINYPVEKVYSQFSNLQNFVDWNIYFSQNKNYQYSFFSPYDGQGSSMSFSDKKNKQNAGEMFIRYANKNKTLRYQLFESSDNTPYLIDVKFMKYGEKTKLKWTIHSPKQKFFKRSLNLFTSNLIAEDFEKSVKNLYAILGNKVEKEALISNIKYDSLMVEKQEGQLLIGINVSTKNDKDALYKNIILNHNKVINFVKIDLEKKDDEFGMPILLTETNNFKDKEVSYFYGVSVPKRISINDNNFSFKTINSSSSYVMFYKGNYAGRVKIIQQLLAKAKKDTMRNGELQQVFLEEPALNKECLIKFSLPVFR